MKKLLSVLLAALLLLGTVAAGLSAAAEEPDPYNWQPLPTSPEGLAEGDYYLNYTGNWYNRDIQDIHLETGSDAQWYLDEDAMVLKGPYQYPPSAFPYTLKPDAYPLSMKYLVYRFLTRVGENWERIGMRKAVRGYRLDFTALAEQVIDENDALTANDLSGLVNMWEQGEWFVDFNSRQLKGCYAVPDWFSQAWAEPYQVLLPSQEYFQLCVTNQVPQMVDLSSLQGHWNNNISWKLEDGTLTISGTGVMERQKEYHAPVHSRLHYHNQTISFSSGSYTDKDLLSEVLNDFCLAYLGYSDFDVLGADLAFGRLDVARVADYYNSVYRLVKTLVIEEGITEIDGGILTNIFPETIILPSSLVRAGDTESYSRSAFSTGFAKDVYVLNADLDFSTSSIPYCGYLSDRMPQSFDAYADLYFETALLQTMAEPTDGLNLYEEALRNICEIRAGRYESSYSYDDTSKTEATVLADWNYSTGMDFSTTDALIAEGIRVINNRFGTAFATLDDVYETEQEGSTIAQRTDAYRAVYTAYYNDLLDEVLAEHPEYMLYIAMEESLLGQALPDSEIAAYFETELVSFPWLTIHGYSGSTAETAAAASGVQFVPVCPNNYAHTVIEKDAVYPRAGFHEHGHKAGLFCEVCGIPLVGGEVIHNQDGERRNEIPATVDAPGSVEIQCDEPTCMGWGLYELPQLEPDEPDQPNQPDQPDQPDQPQQPSGDNGGGQSDNGGDSDSGNFFTRFVNGLKKAAKSFVDVFLRLIRWLGGKK